MGYNQNLFHLSKGKTTPGYALKIYPLTFFSRKNAVVTTENFIPSLFMAKTYAVERLNNKEFTGCSNFCEGDLQKENRQRTVISSACCGIYFSKQKQDRAIPFPIIFLLRF